MVVLGILLKNLGLNGLEVILGIHFILKEMLYQNIII